MDDTLHDESVVLSYQKALSTLFRLISGLTAVGALLYLLGWVRSYGYYQSFKAEWILPNLSFSEFASRGIWPISALLLGLLWTFTDIAKHRIGVGIKLTKSLLVLLVMWFVALVAVIVLPKYGYHSHAANFAASTVYFSASVAMAQFGEVVLELRKNDFNWRSKQIRTLFWAMVFFLGMTFLFGSREGESEKRDTTSTLPLVALTDGSTDVWRLLASQEEMLYLVRLAGDLPSIKIIKVDKVAEITTNSKSSTDGTMERQQSSSKELFHLGEQSALEGLRTFPSSLALTTLCNCYSDRTAPFPPIGKCFKTDLSRLSQRAPQS